MRFDKKTIEKAKGLRVIDDALFKLIAVRTEVCQEILRTLLDDDKLIVIKSDVQKHEVSLYRELILDALCTLGDGTLCNIEMQKSDSNNDIKRLRYHASLITSNHTQKGTSFNDIPNVKVLYIAEYDVLNNHQAVTHISRCQLKGKTYKPLNDGEDLVVINAKSKQKSKHSRLLKLFLKSESFYDEMYPALSKAMKHFKETKKGREEVCKSIQEYAEEYAENRELIGFIGGCVECKLTLKEVMEKVKKRFKNVTEEEIDSIYNSATSRAK